MAASAHRRLAILSSHLVPTGNSSFGTFEANATSATAAGSRILEGQVAIVTGSGQGIGAATAKLFAQQGAKVVVTDLDAAKAEKVVAEIKAEGGAAIAVPGDVTAVEFPDRLVQETIKAFGKLNIIVNNAGYTWDGILHRMTDKQWEAMLLVHNTAPFRIIRAAAPFMRDAAKDELEKKGVAEPRCIINISSTSGLHGNAGQVNYSTAKAGVCGMTKTIAKEWGMFGIRCNAIAFGWIDTRLTKERDPKEGGEEIEVDGQKVKLGIPKNARPGNAEAFIPMKRKGTPEEAAGSVLLLASPYAGYITGHTLEVTGGAGI
jgi:3-oxoacyl-[acyl-carrier protein] reductase